MEPWEYMQNHVIMDVCGERVQNFPYILTEVRDPKIQESKLPTEQ